MTQPFYYGGNVNAGLNTGRGEEMPIGYNKDKTRTHVISMIYGFFLFFFHEKPGENPVEKGVPKSKRLH